MLSPVELDIGARFAGQLRALGFRVESGDFSIGRPDRPTLAVRGPDGGAAIAKAYPPGAAVTAYDNLRRVWQSSFGCRRAPPGVPEPLAFLADIDALITDRVAGQPLAATVNLDLEVFDDSIRLIAELHASDAQPARRRTSRGILRSLGRKLEFVARAAPQFTEGMRAVVGALEAARPNDRELVPSHGDCSPRNILVAADRLVLIDWDRLQLADPARDVAYCGIWNWKQDLKQGRAPRRELLERAAEVYETCRPLAHIRRRLPFHVAAGLIRQAASLVQLWPEDIALVPGLLELARKELR